MMYRSKRGVATIVTPEAVGPGSLKAIYKDRSAAERVSFETSKVAGGITARPIGRDSLIARILFYPVHY
jgi:hypothetical protein